MNPFHAEFVAPAWLIADLSGAFFAGLLTHHLVWPALRRLAQHLRGLALRHHDEGLQELAMDDMACKHFDIPTTGLGYRIWRCRVYLCAVLMSVFDLRVDHRPEIRGLRSVINRWLYRRWIAAIPRASDSNEPAAPSER